MLHQLTLNVRRSLAALLAAAAVAYVALLAATYFKTTAPSLLVPDFGELDRWLFSAAPPISPMERRLEAADTPLVAGPLISGPTMGSPFARKSNEGTQALTQTDLDEREGERQALLDWIRSGASKSAYDQDDFALPHPV